MAGGRPRIFVERLLIDHPAPTPQPTPCRIWQGAMHSSGYGVLGSSTHKPIEPGSGYAARCYAKMYAHRWVWEAVNGPIPPKMVVRHKCDNRLCYRLSHLELGTVAQNNDDARRRGHLGGELALKPSEMTRFFDLLDEGRSVRSILREHHPDLAETTLYRYKKLGRQAFEDLWNPDAAGWRRPEDDPRRPPSAADRYGAWRNREP